MSCNELDNELMDIHIIKEYRVFIDSHFQGYPFRPPKKYKPTKQAFWCRRNLHGIVWNKGCLDYSELPKIIFNDVKGENFPKGTEKCKFLGSVLGKEVENSDDQGCSAVRDLVDEEVWICSS